MIVPMPPAGDAPPIKAAAMQSNSNSVPAVGVADRNREANMTPPKAASIPIEPKTNQVIRLTLMPLN